MAIVPDLARPWVVDPHSSPNPGVTNGKAPAVITPSDSVDLNPHIDGIYVGVTGNLTVTPRYNASDAGILFTAVPVGWFPIKCRRVWATGTTATGLVGAID